MAHKFDKIDLKILSDLQQHGRLTNVELARRAGISAPPCLRRVRSLETMGTIRGYHAQVNPTSLGFTVTIYAKVSLESHSDIDLKEFEERVKSWPLVRECHMLTGDADFLLKVVAENWDSYQEFLTSILTKTEHVKNVKSELVLRSVKDVPGVPVETIAAF